MNNDFDFIKDKFENDGVSTPDSIDERVIEKLDSNHKTIPLFKSRAFKTAVSLVACLAVFVASLSVAVTISDNRLVENDAVSSSDMLKTFKDENELEKYVKSLGEEYFYGVGGLTSKGDSFIFDNAATAAVDEATASAPSSSDTPDFASTYVQEKGVDEADTIKTNGRYIFKKVSHHDDEDFYHSAINIFEVNNGKSKKVSSVDFKTNNDDRFDDAGNLIDKEIIDFFIYNNYLVIELGVYKHNDYVVFDAATEEVADGDIRYTGGWQSEQCAECLIYDISDITKPKQVYSFEQKGNYASSRMIGDKLYFVTSYEFFRDDAIDCYLPYTCANGNELKNVDVGNIAYSESKQRSFTVVSEIDIAKQKQVGQTKSVIGAGSDVYCTTNSLYVLGCEYSKKGEKTFVAKIDFKNGIEFVSSCKMKGRFDSQYSFYEKDGNFYACITAWNKKAEKDYNRIYSFDEKLNRISKTESFGIDESVRAVKYIGNYAYVITYEQIDPLFVIDISDPADMQIKGSVEITGFSTMLVPIGENLLVGIGNATEDTEYTDMEAVSGIKLALFDISDPENPTVLDSKEYIEKSSAAQNDPKALIINNKKGYMAIPYDMYDEDESGAIIFTVDGDKLKELDAFSYSFDADDENAFCHDTRITYVGDYIYSLDDFGNVSSHLVK